MIDNNELYEKFRLNVAISNFEKEEIKTPKKNILKMVASFILTIGITSGLVYATGTVVYENIWREPKSYKITMEVSEEDKKKCISEEEAERIAYSYLEKTGFTEDEINSFGLSNDFWEDEKIWRLYSKNIPYIEINAETGKLNSLNIPSYNYKIPYNYGITRNQAQIVAQGLFEKYNEDENQNGKYELASLRGNMETEEGSYIWYASFYKKYGDLYNFDEAVHIGWVPTVNGLYSLSFSRNVYEENEEKITKDQAIQIAVEKDRQIEKEKQIIGTTAEIRIRKMNENIYLRENFKEEYDNHTLNVEKTGENTYKLKDDAVFYKTDERVRKVWCVVVQYDLNTDFVTAEYTYYVDCTTGEIIGGERSNDLKTEERTIEEVDELIEK